MKRDELTRRQFLKTAKKWSKVAIAGAIAAAAVVTPDRTEAASWVNRRGGGWGWINHYGGGWLYRPGSWVNGRGGGWGWINRR